jgi:GNAT superfamily N-acetyltransferase
MTWQSGPLRVDHDLTAFASGVDSLDIWLRDHALRAQRADTARTFVWTGPEDGRVVAYYSISASQLVRAEISGSLAGGYSVVPTFLLARLALDRSLHGQGLGSELLVDALETLVRAADRAAARLVVVDAIDDRAAAFYRRHDFVPLKDNPRRLVMKVATARKALGVSSMHITPDHDLRLVSVEWRLPDGRILSAVMSAAEVQAIGEGMAAEAQRQLAGSGDNGEEGDVVLDFGGIIRRVLGRDPFRP